MVLFCSLMFKPFRYSVVVSNFTVMKAKNPLMKVRVVVFFYSNRVYFKKKQ